MRCPRLVLTSTLERIPIHHKYPNDWRQRYHWVRTAVLECNHVIVEESDFGPPKRRKKKFCKECEVTA